MTRDWYSLPKRARDRVLRMMQSDIRNQKYFKEEFDTEWLDAYKAAIRLLKRRPRKKAK